MPLLNGFGLVMNQMMRRCVGQMGDQVARILIQVTLIFLERQHIVCLFVDNGLRNSGLTAHRVNRHDTAV